MVTALLGMAAFAFAGAPASDARPVSGAGHACTPQCVSPPVAPTLSAMPASRGSARRSVREFGARGDDRRDDTAALRRAVRVCAASGVELFFPAGTYLFRELTLPAGSSLVGAGRAGTILRGAVTVGSRVSVSHLQMGVAGKALRFARGAHHTTFRRVKLVGGGGQPAEKHHGVIRFDWGRAAHHITFRECIIGRNVRGGNGVCIVDSGRSRATYHHLRWIDCHFRAQRRMAFECIQRSGGAPITTGYRDIDLISCVFEPSGSVCVSFDGSARCGDSLVEDCLIKGAGARRSARFGTGLELNGVTRMTVRGSTILRTRGPQITIEGIASRAGGNRILDCVFDTRRAHVSTTPDKYTPQVIMSKVRGATVAGCRFAIDRGSQSIYLQYSSRNTFRDSTFVDHRRGSRAHEQLWITRHSSRNLFQGNRFSTSSDWASVVVRDGADANVFRGNSFARDGRPVFSIDSGLLVRRSGNSVE